MLKKLESISRLIGNTPCKKLTSLNAAVHVKLEYNNYSGSIKDRAALKIITEGIKSGLIHENTTIVESSSGNFAIALASICKAIGLNFIAVIDPNINRAYEEVLKLLCYKIEKVEEVDETGGYLLTRINKVHEICRTVKNCYWTNQYENPNNYLAYYDTLAVEMRDFFDTIELLFVGVSSCGTITGLSRRIKEEFPTSKIVAVDVEGSVIFNQVPQRRYVTGIGASKVPSILKHAFVDSVSIVSQENIIKGCHELLEEQTIFGGASAGASYFAIKEYLRNHDVPTDANVLFLCPDRGTAYLDTIYNSEWGGVVKKASKREVNV